MAKFPKLKVIQPYWDVPEEIRDIEQGKYLPFCSHIRIVVEGQVVSSYEELLSLVAEDRHKDKDFLEVRFFEIISGG
ncbi:MAG: hypothetical protein ABIL06_14270 [Pseudomonadota bacterium]